MSRPVDERIVKLSMDNNSFKQNSEKSLSLLAKLSQKLSGVKNMNLDKSVKSMDDLNGKTSKFDMNKLISAAEAVSSRFSTMGVIATTVLSNITSRAVDAGVSLAKSLTLDGAMDGFQEYELKMKSIQTIMSNTMGNSSLDDVKNTLEELNTYADQTIYNFADMTSNIGTFTAAGVNLKDSATAIKGIANLAAASGSNTQQASTAMYQLSQALANGKVNLQDWNSVVNAGMGGKLFQNALKETAAGLGQNIDASKSFRDSLQDGWLTTDVLIQTLDRFSKDQSMLEAATKVRTFTQLVDTAKEAVGSGWGTTWELLFGDFEEAGIMWTKANDVISKSIDSSAKSRNEFVKSFVDMGGKAKLIDIVANSYKGLNSIIGIVKGAFQDIFPPLTVEQLIKMVDKVKEFTASLSLNEQTAGKVRSVFRGLFSILSIGVTVVKTVGKALLNLIPDKLGGDILNLAAKWGEIITKFAESIKSSENVNQMLEKIGQTANKVYQGLKDTWGKLTGVFDNFGESVKKMWNKVKPTFEALGKAFKDMFKGVGGDDIATVGTLGILFLGVKKLMGLGGKLSEFMENLGSLVDKAKGAFKVFEDLGDSLQTLTGAVKAGSLLAIAAAVMALALALGMLGNMKSTEIAKGLLSIAAILKMLDASLASMTKHAGGIAQSAAASGVIIAVAGSVMVMSAALKVISTIDLDRLGPSLLAMAGMVTMLVAAIKVLSSETPQAVTGASAMLALSGAILVLSQAVKTLGQMNSDEIQQGLLGLGAILLELSAFIKLTSGSTINPGTAVSVLIIASSLKMISNAVIELGNLSMDDIQQGLVALGIILLELSVTMQRMNGIKGGSAITILAMAGAINMLVPPLKTFAAMSIEELAKGLITLGLGLASLVLGAQGAKSALPGALAIMVMAGAINALVPALQAFGNMSLEQIGKGLVVLAGSMIVFAAGANAIGLVGSLALVSLSVTLVAFSVAATATGIALMVFIKAFQMLGTTTSSVVKNVVKSIVTLIKGFGDAAAEISVAVGKIVMALLGELRILIPEIAETGLAIILSLLQALSSKLPDIIDVGVDICVKLMQGIADGAPKLLEAAVRMIIDLVNGLADAIRDNSPTFVRAVFNMMEAMLEVIVDVIAKIGTMLFGWIPGAKDKIEEMAKGSKEALRDAFDIDDAEEIGLSVGKGYGDGIDKSDAPDKAKNVAEKSKEALIAPDFTPEGIKKMDDFGAGMEQSRAADEAARKKAREIEDVLGLTDFGALGERNMQGYGGGVRSFDPTSDANAVTDKTKQALIAPDFTQEGLAKGSQFGTGVGLSVEENKGKAQTVSEQTKGAMGLPDFTPVGSDKGKQYITGIDGKTVEAKTAGQNVSENAKAGTTIPDFTPAGLTKANQFTGGLDQKQTQAKGSGKGVSEAAKTGAATPNFTGTGMDKANQFTGGIGKISGNPAGAGLAGQAKSGAESVDASSSGAFFGDGFVGGIQSKEGAAQTAGSRLGSLAKSAMDAILKIFSPSRATRESGGYFGEGFTIGIDNMRGKVAQSAERLGTASLTALDRVVTNVNDVIASNLNLEPIITPTVDDSKFKYIKGLSIDATLGGSFGSSGPIVSIDPQSFKDISLSLMSQNDDKNFKSLEKKIDALTDAMAGMSNAFPKTIENTVNIDGKQAGKTLAPIIKTVNTERENLLNQIEGVR